MHDYIYSLMEPTVLLMEPPNSAFLPVSPMLHRVVCDNICASPRLPSTSVTTVGCTVGCLPLLKATDSRRRSWGFAQRHGSRYETRKAAVQQRHAVSMPFKSNIYSVQMESIPIRIG